MHATDPWGQLGSSVEEPAWDRHLGFGAEGQCLQVPLRSGHSHSCRVVPDLRLGAPTATPPPGRKPL